MMYVQLNKISVIFTIIHFSLIIYPFTSISHGVQHSLLSLTLLRFMFLEATSLHMCRHFNIQHLLYVRLNCSVECDVYNASFQELSDTINTMLE